MEIKNCLFCKSEIIAQPQNLSMHCICPYCGKFNLTSQMYSNGTMVYFRDNERLDIWEKKYLIAGWMYEFNRVKDAPYNFNGIDDFDEILRDNRIPQTPMQRFERFLLNLYKADSRVGKSYMVSPDGGFAEDFNSLPSLSYAIDLQESTSMLDALFELGYLLKKPHPDWDYNYFSISPKGFEHAEQLLSTNIDSKSVFIAMGFKEDLLKAHKIAIRPACKDCGFNARLISERPHNNGITDEIIAEIKRSKFVIVDFTYNNNGAYWEAGYAQGLGLPIIRCCKEEWYNGTDENGNKNTLHFDIRHYNTIIWKDHKHLKKELKNNIRANISDAILEDIKKNVRSNPNER